MEFNLSALNTYRNAHFNNANDIAVLDGSQGLKANGSLSSLNIFRWIRSDETKESNNAVRTELLKSLGQAFGLDGIGKNREGKVTFTWEFMDKLSTILGPAFKASDFGFNENTGLATSGKPLTSRRIQAIMSKAVLYTPGATFDVQEYKQKLSAIKAELHIPDTADLSNEQTQKLWGFSGYNKVFSDVDKCLKFLELYDKPELIRTSLEYEEKLLDNKDVSDDYPYEIRDPKTGGYRPLINLDQLRNDYLGVHIGNNLIHLENAGFHKQPEPEEDLKKNLKKLRDYVTGTISTFVKGAIDTYLSAFIAGKTRLFLQHLEHPGACMEAKCRGFEQFQIKHFGSLNDITEAQVAELNKLADTGSDVPLHQCIAAEMDGIFQDQPEIKWEEMAPMIKQRLVGGKHPITTAEVVDDKVIYKPVLKEGKPVIREITEEDIDRVGKIMFDNI